jgi:uncharacterized protein YdaU (DUF1376 family)
MPLYIADYLKDTSHLRALESGAYLHLIMAYWANGKLPNNERQLATIAKLTDEEWCEHRETLAAFFEHDWTHKRVEAELSEANEKISKKAAAGKVGGKASAKQRASKRSTGASAEDQADGQAKPKQTATQSQPHSSEAKASDADASESDAAKLWKEAIPQLVSMGVKETQGRQMVGRWLRDCGDDHAELLRVISRARDQCPHDPIPWVTASLKPRKKNDEKSVHAAIDRAVGYFEQLDQPAGAICGGEGAGVIRRLPQGRRE